MKIARSKPREVEYVIWHGGNQTEIAEFLNHDRSLFEWEDAVLGRRKLILKQDIEVEIPRGHYLYKENNVVYVASKDAFLKMFDVQ